MSKEDLILDVIQKYYTDDGYRELCFLELWEQCYEEEVTDRKLYWSKTDLLFKIYLDQDTVKYVNSRNELFCINHRLLEHFNQDLFFYKPKDNDQICELLTPIVNKILKTDFGNISYFF